VTRKQHLLLEILMLLLILNGCAPVPKVEKWKDSLVIVPGRGIQEITLGTSSSTVLEIMGEPENRTTYEEEHEAYACSGFNPDTLLEFHLGFDHCFEYSMDLNRSMYPIYKIFFKQNAIHVIMFSAFVYEPDLLQNIFIVSEELKFYSNTGDMKRVLGTNYVYHPLTIYTYDPETRNFVLIEGYDIYDYLEQGISVIVASDEIVSVQIYPPVSSEIKRRYMNTILNIPYRGINCPLIAE
jgi:hypothetical protein